MHAPFHLYEFTLRSFEANGERVGYRVAGVDRYVGISPIASLGVPSVVADGLHKVLSPIMTATNTGVGLIVFLQKS